MSLPFLTGAWEKLILINYAINPEVLQPYIPACTELDSYKGVCYVSVVGFVFSNVKAAGLFPIPGYKKFPEINLRFYVRYYENGTLQRGIVFIREIVPKKALAWVANTFFGEKYCVLPAQHSVHILNGQQHICYKWKTQNSWDHISVRAACDPVDIKVGSEEEFITENHWGYTKRTGTTTSSFEVHHPHWKLYPIYELDYKIEAIEELFGAAFRPYLQAKPLSVFLAEGSAIKMQHVRILKK